MKPLFHLLCLATVSSNTLLSVASNTTSTTSTTSTNTTNTTHSAANKPNSIVNNHTITLEHDWTDRKANRRCFPANIFSSQTPSSTRTATPLTLLACKQKCEKTIDEQSGEKCVAIEWSDQGARPSPRATETRTCGLSFNCDRLKKWKEGSTYVMQDYFDLHSVDEGYNTVNFYIVLQILTGFFSLWIIVRLVRFKRGGRNNRTVPSSLPMVNVVAVRVSNIDLVMDIATAGPREGEQREETTTLCYVCLEECHTCSTCVCRIAIHSACMENIPNKQICSVCHTAYGSTRPDTCLGGSVRKEEERDKSSPSASNNTSDNTEERGLTFMDERGDAYRVSTVRGREEERSYL